MFSGLEAKDNNSTKQVTAQGQNGVTELSEKKFF